jgi:hypothetical protein
MASEVKDPKIEADGSISVLLDGKTIKLVKETDLLAVKGGAERKEAELLTSLAEANRTKDESHQSSLKLQAQIGELETIKTKTVPELTQKLQDLTKQFEGTKAENTVLSGKVLNHAKSDLITFYGVPEDKIKDLPLAEVVKMQEAFEKAGVKKRGVVTYDNGNAPSGTPPSGYKTFAQRVEETKAVKK